MPARSAGPTDAPGSRPRVIVIDAPGALRATIRMGAPAYDASSPDRFAGAVAAHVLGAGVHSRLGTFVRSEKGYAYTVGADFVPRRTYGFFRASARTDAETAAQAVATMLQVIAQLRQRGDVTPAELSAAKAYLAARDVVQCEGSMQRVVRRLVREIGTVAGDVGEEDRVPDAGLYDSRIENVTADDVRDVIEKYVRPQAMTVVVVAPAAIVAGPLAKVGDVQVIAPPQVGAEEQE
jgi:predicted Zn-dependent peptidase